MPASVSLQLWQVCWGNGSYPKIWRLPQNLDNVKGNRYHKLAFTHMEGRAMLESNPSNI